MLPLRSRPLRSSADKLNDGESLYCDPKTGLMRAVEVSQHTHTHTHWHRHTHTHTQHTHTHTTHRHTHTLTHTHTHTHTHTGVWVPILSTSGPHSVCHVFWNRQATPSKLHTHTHTNSNAYDIYDIYFGTYMIYTLAREVEYSHYKNTSSLLRQ
jgi:hypothetical protein